MRRIGLTGNIGSGKSTVAKIFEILGVPVFYSDRVGRELYSRPDVKDKLKFLFPETNFYIHGVFQKSIMAQLIFTDSDALQKVNDLIHPLVEEEFLKWSADYIHEIFVVQESAILFENQLEYKYDEVILVTAPQSLRLSRVMERDQVSLESVMHRINNQLSEEYKQSKSQHIVNNNEKQMLIPQVVELFGVLRSIV